MHNPYKRWRYYLNVETMNRKGYLVLLLSVLILVGCNASRNSSSAQDAVVSINSLPRNIYIEGGKFHVQGVVVDVKRGYAYFSFTTSLVKTNLKGEIIGSVEGFLGHLGCLDVNPEDGRLYASLEYKSDNIGKGILKGWGNDSLLSKQQGSSFYIAIFDPEKITRPGMHAEKDPVLTTVYLKEVLDDYTATVKHKGKEVQHRYGCSGIDGISFGPQFGKKNGKTYLNVAYGIYSDTSRSDNDYQVILQYDPRELKKYERRLSQNHFEAIGPDKPLNKYFVYTGNTTYGIQNLEYDPYTGFWLAAVYNGKKTLFPNYGLFAIDGGKAPVLETLKRFDNGEKGKVLQLAKAGSYDVKTNTYGWHFKWGATGIHSLGNGYFYISENGTTKEKKQYCNLQLYRWTGNPDIPFEKVK